MELLREKFSLIQLETRGEGNYNNHVGVVHKVRRSLRGRRFIFAFRPVHKVEKPTHKVEKPLLRGGVKKVAFVTLRKFGHDP